MIMIICIKYILLIKKLITYIADVNLIYYQKINFLNIYKVRARNKIRLRIY